MELKCVLETDERDDTVRTAERGASVALCLAHFCVDAIPYQTLNLIFIRLKAVEIFWVNLFAPSKPKGYELGLDWVTSVPITELLYSPYITGT